MGAGPARAQLALTLESKIPLGDIRGRLDHMAVDLHRQRLLVAELENDSVGVIDFERREIVHMITDVKRPQGLAYVPAADTLFVANGGDGSLRMFEGAQYRALEPIHVGDDADNLRFDPESNLIYVAYGEGALGIVDVASRRKIRDLALTAHPESFQLERQTNPPSVNPRADGGHQNEKRRLNGCSPGGRFPTVTRCRERRPECGIVTHAL